MINHVLLIDDDLKFLETFQREAQQKALRVTHKRSFDGLKQMMPAYQRSFAAIILDIKCLISDRQEKEDQGFIGTALTYLNSTCPGFPRLILTGDDAAFASFKSFNPGEEIFLKTPEGLSDVLSRLQYYSDNSVDLTIKRENAEVFKIFADGYLDSATEILMLDLIKAKGEVDFTKYGGILRNIRALQEMIYKTINVKNKLAVPDSMLQPNGMIKFNALMRHLNGTPATAGGPPTTKQFQNSAIFNMADCLYWTSGKYIHADPSEKYRISRYTVSSLTDALMEIFLWARPYLK
jgi:ActR/RegA family two-component response regulator